MRRIDIGRFSYSLQVGVPVQAMPAEAAAWKKGSAVTALFAGIAALLIIISAGAWYLLVAGRSR